MIEQQAIVVAVETDRLLLEAERQSSCQSCSVKSGCGTSVLAKWFDKKHLHFYVDKPDDSGVSDVEVGDTVIVGLQESALTQGALTVYLLPLLLMIAVALLVDSWLPDGYYWRDLVIAGSAVAGLLLALGLGRLYIQRSHCKQRYSPVLLSYQNSKTPSEKS